MDRKVDERDLVPADQWDVSTLHAKQGRPPSPPELVARAASLGVRLEDLAPPKSPLGETAGAFYETGGCFNLAMALNEKTDLPIEVFYRDGRPRHAYVVDGDQALDYRGRNPVKLVRAGAQETRMFLTPDALLTALEEHSEEAANAAAIYRSVGWIEAASNAADSLLELTDRAGAAE